MMAIVMARGIVMLRLYLREKKGHGPSTWTAESGIRQMLAPYGWPRPCPKLLKVVRIRVLDPELVLLRPTEPYARPATLARYFSVPRDHFDADPPVPRELEILVYVEPTL